MDFEPKEMNLHQFARITGGTTSNDVESHIHAGLRSAPTTKTYKRSFDKELKRLQDARDFTLRQYERAIETGIIKRPAKLTRGEIAAGDPTLPHVQAARRILEKQELRAKNAHTESKLDGQ